VRPPGEAPPPDSAAPVRRRAFRPTIRVRLTALYAGVVALTIAVILVASYELMDHHLRRTLPDDLAKDALGRLATQYVIAFVGAILLAVALGYALASRALAPLARITATARQVSEDRLSRRIAPTGPDDELRELAETFDAMLDRLESSFGAQRRFIANASHELRSPLTVIRTEADVALEDPAADREELREALRGVLEGADRTEALLEGLLVLAQSQRGFAVHDRVDLAPALEDAVAAVVDEARSAGIEIRSSAAPAPVLGDGALLGRLVANLVENAVRHNHRGGTVEATTHREGPWSAVRVTNTGAVLSDEQAARLTEPFERLGRRAGAGGSGLGLSIVESVTTAHGGRLSIRPLPRGGLRVEVLLPAPGATRGDEAATSPGPGSSGDPGEGMDDRSSSSPGDRPRTARATRAPAG
jgi:signal transduction histidine kinase